MATVCPDPQWQHTGDEHLGSDEAAAVAGDALGRLP